MEIQRSAAAFGGELGDERIGLKNGPIIPHGNEGAVDVTNGVEVFIGGSEALFPDGGIGGGKEQAAVPHRDPKVVAPGDAAQVVAVAFDAGVSGGPVEIVRAVAVDNAAVVHGADKESVGERDAAEVLAGVER